MEFFSLGLLIVMMAVGGPLLLFWISGRPGIMQTFSTWAYWIGVGILLVQLSWKGIRRLVPHRARAQRGHYVAITVDGLLICRGRDPMRTAPLSDRVALRSLKRKAWQQDLPDFQGAPELDRVHERAAWTTALHAYFSSSSSGPTANP